LNKRDVVESILTGKPRSPGRSGQAFAAANIALCKYWGKRDEELNLPLTSSLSISLRTHGTTTDIEPADADEYWMNGERLAPASPIFQRLKEYLDLFATETPLRVATQSNIPIGAGLASSASVFASVALALDRLFDWRLDRRALSILARLGSGSACRSIDGGFVEWRAGTDPDGMDSYGAPLPDRWPELRIGLLLVSKEAKSIGSRPAMKRTRETSVLYTAWPDQAARDLARLKEAIAGRDFVRLGETAEANALAMHATMIATWPPVLYWRPESVEAMRRVWALRDEGKAVYFTMDAGPNLKLLYRETDQAVVDGAFPGVETIAPFA
jgi:diphosphomevalonate decarboxylase